MCLIMVLIVLTVVGFSNYQDVKHGTDRPLITDKEGTDLFQKWHVIFTGEHAQLNCLSIICQDLAYVPGTAELPSPERLLKIKHEP